MYEGVCVLFLEGIISAKDAKNGFLSRNHHKIKSFHYKYQKWLPIKHDFPAGIFDHSP